MSEAARFRTGKGERDENFPVAKLFSPRHRGPILAFYRFVRTADDVADHATLTSAEKIALLDAMAATLDGRGDEPEALRLRAILVERSLAPRHALDLLAAFRLDAEKARYRDWDDLIDYCRLSAMPVGRFVLDVHGEDRATRAASDPLCAALQIINHLQDCGKDFRDLDRVYLPQEVLALHGASIEDLGAARGSPALLDAIRELAGRAGALLDESRGFAGLTRDRRLGLEVAVIQSLAEGLVRKLMRRDPLAERVHASRGEMVGLTMLGLVQGLWRRRPEAGRRARAGAA